MLGIGLFWVATLLLFIAASGFFVPPLLAACVLSRKTKSIAIVGLMALLGILCAGMYAQLGGYGQLRGFYTPESIALRQTSSRVRPLYARLQRELVKCDLDLPLDLNNAELILQFAKLQSQTQQGQLLPDTQKLLQALLKAAPKQVTALNLLAINAYKEQDFPQALHLWQVILDQIPVEMADNSAVTTLRDKILQTRAKLENIKTNPKI